MAKMVEMKFWGGRQSGVPYKQIFFYRQTKVESNFGVKNVSEK